MKKKLYLCFILITFCIAAKADHITGGEINYTYSIDANGNYNYQATFKLFMRCFSNRQFNNPTIISVFDKATNARVTNLTVPLSSTEQLNLTNPDPCISDPPTVCYVVGYYNFSVTLPPTPNGYILSSYVNFRISGINNLELGYNNVGATYTAEIPGTSLISSGPKNNSARFVGNDLVVVCANNRFAYSFAAADSDNDNLRYSFCEAYNSSLGGGFGNMNAPPPTPPYNSVPYGNGFSASVPLGNDVKIDANTGLITGIAPESGVYVVTVCVEEIRNGIVIARQRKDLQINIAPCNVAAAALEAEYMLCNDTKTLPLINLSTSPLIRTSFWQITDRAGATIFTSANTTDTYTFADTGIYNVKLVINRGENCSDSTVSIARVYPGFKPDFSFTGICFNKPTNFSDASTSVYGIVNDWSWTFDGSFNTVKGKTATYTFPGLGRRNVDLLVSNSVGCKATVSKVVDIVTAPPVNLAFKDTLICVGDPVTLKADGSGFFSWTPNNAMINAATANPTVTPAVTTKYYVNIDDNGCLNKDSVLVRVTDHVTLSTMPDTTICLGDTIKLRVQSDAFRYSWSPASQVLDPNTQNPLVVTVNSTTYQLTANIGSCSATGNIKVSTVAYPFVKAGNDTAICFNSYAQLNAVTNSASFRWSPPQTLNNPAILNPLATPAATTKYIISAYDNRGCPKPGTDTLTVTVMPFIAPFAGNDTSVIIEQPLQLQASGGTIYRWSPPLGLSATNIANPVAMYSQPLNSIRYKVVVSNQAGCEDSAFVTVKVYNTGPTIFVPTAFTPNADGRNDVLRPIAAGIKQLELFEVYNRWGQRVFTTREIGKGWDGSVNGVAQATGSFVWLVKAIDYLGKPYFKKGTVTLIK